MNSVSSRHIPHPVLSEKEILKQLSTIDACNKQLAILEERKKSGHILLANAKAKGERAKALEASGNAKIESGRAKMQTGQTKIESGRAMQVSGQMKIDLAQVQIESGRAMQESGRAMQESARIKMDQVTAMREKECKEINEEMDSAIEQLEDMKRDIESLKDNNEKGEIIEELNCLIKKAIQLKAEAKPTASLAPVNEKINVFGEECVHLFTKLEKFI